MASSSEVIVAPSVLAADIGNLLQDVDGVVSAGAEWLHVDIMDGSFVPPISFGGSVVKTLRGRFPKTFLDTHLMVVEPERHFEAFKEAGADRLIVHRETCPHLHRSLGAIRSLGMKNGVAVNPGTPVESVFDVLDVCDLVLVMTVNPGWGGQPFIASCLKKIEALQREISRAGANVLIEVDGGINAETARRCRDVGARVFVAGSYVFGAKDRASAIRSLRA